MSARELRRASDGQRDVTIRDEPAVRGSPRGRVPPEHLTLISHRFRDGH